MNDNIITFGELRKLINDVPADRDEDLLSVYDLVDGQRFNVANLDLSIDGTIDLNFNSEQWSEGKDRPFVNPNKVPPIPIEIR
jgi:hypothetical protein